MKNTDYIGTEINGIKIVDYYIDNTGGQRRPRFKCLCVCGKIFEPRAETIKNETTKSCGCQTIDLQISKRTLEGDTAIINRLFRQYRDTAVRRDFCFLLTPEEFKAFIGKNCVYCGSPPRLSIFSASEKWKRKEKRLHYNGIDRVDSDIGYVIDNCVSCCSICNRAKYDLSLEEFQQWTKQLARFVSQNNNGTK